ncbi:ribosome-associated ATPase/putative transporter RbbA [Neisseria sicca]|uniref:ribosome-associated ATPase/putative transporter RbbA n=1 Tax=Neisseria sicca TaxID=490 RepID=UPI000D32201F|nr:ribosome-associated ATPase/putative transporter RbbA [Neisseria sicca]
MNTVSIQNLSHRYGKTLALDDVSLDIPKGATVGLIGPDGVGKSTLLSLMAGVKVIQDGRVEVLGGDMADKDVRRDLSHRIAFMPQGLGRNLYPTLSVYENIDFHARLFGLDGQERTRQIARLMEATRLAPFSGRAAGKLSGGMKQKLSLCCALVHSPDLLILDEPTTGVDPLSRRQFWALVDDLRREHAGMTVIVATAYIEEAQRFERLLAMDAGRLLENKPTADVLADYGTDVLEEAYVKMLPPEKQQGSGGLDITPFVPDPDAPPAMEAHGLTKRFGDFTAVDHVSFTIQKGEIFGFLGSNGCGKSTTMKMLTGLLEATEGAATLLGKPIDAGGLDTKMRVGYMSQAFSLYEELSVRRNLDLHARLYQMGAKGAAAVEEALQQFDLADVADTAPASLPLGIRQRLQLAAACLHHPEVLILDEPTSGVDPAARDMFWRHLLKLSREDKITIFVSTHFMNEAARCDRISFMHKGRVLAVGTPAELAARQNAPDLEEAFVQYLIEAEGGDGGERSSRQEAAHSESEQREFRQNTDGVREQSSYTLRDNPNTQTFKYRFSMIWTFARREAKELLRDKIRLFFAVFGPLIIMASVSWGISFDVRNLKFAVYDRDQTAASRELVEYFDGSRYFLQQPPIQSEAEIDTVLKSSGAILVIDIPSGFGRDLARGLKPEVGFYVDGSMPFNATNIRGYIGSLITAYTKDRIAESGLPVSLKAPAGIEPRFMYNQDFDSINAIAPGVMMLVLMMIPAMMSAVGVVREREIGSIANFYASPAAVAQYLIGKQLPYIAVGMVNFAAMMLMIIYLFGVPLKGSFTGLAVGTFLMVSASTALGLLISCFVRSQLAAIFATAIITMIPAQTYSGFLYPLSTMEGGALIIGKTFPSSWYYTVSVGSFTKGLHTADLLHEYAAIAAFAATSLILACLLLKKQEK